MKKQWFFLLALALIFTSCPDTKTNTGNSSDSAKFDNAKFDNAKFNSAKFEQ